MTGRAAPAATGFHEGELAVQQLAAVADRAARLAGMLAPAELRGGMAGFLARRTFAVLTATGRDGRLWASPLTGATGLFEVSSPTILTVRAAPALGDPLHGLAADQPVGLVVMEFATRRRVRINGTLGHVGDSMLVLGVEQAYGNCPQHIRRRHTPAGGVGGAAAGTRRGEVLEPEDVALIRGADTMFIGSRHPTGGTDSSHRGGPAGFVRVEDARTLWWPDYAGNNMFNTLGNLTVDPHVALVFIDFGTGLTTQLTGRAELDWITPHAPGDDGHTGRRVRFFLDAVVSSQRPAHTSS